MPGHKDVVALFLSLIVVAAAGRVSRADQEWKPLPREEYRKAAAWDVPLHVAEPTGVDRKDWPVTSGVPLPRGAVQSVDQLHLLGPDGKEADLQARVTARWADGSVKWALLDFQATVAAGKTVVFRLVFPREGGPRPGARQTPVGVNAEPNGFYFDSGALRVRVANGPFQMFSADLVRVGGAATKSAFAPMAGKGDATVELGDIAGKSLGRFVASAGEPVKWEVDENGPLRVVLKTTGWHALGEKKTIPYHLRVEAYRGHSFVRVYHTFVMSEDPNATVIREMGLRLPINLDPRGLRCTMGHTEAKTEPLPAGRSAWLLHGDWNRYEVGGEGVARSQHEGAARWVDLSDGAKGVTVFVRDMERMFPKELEVSADGPALTAWLWPRHGGKPLDLRHQLVNPSPEMLDFQKKHARIFRMSEHGGATPEQALKMFNVESGRCAMGVAVTHELFYYFHTAGAAEAKSAELAQAFNRPLVAFVSPQWYCTDTEALGRIHPHDPENFALAEEHLGRVIDFVIRHQNEWSHWYGMLDYGDNQSRRDMIPGEWSRFCCRWGWLNTEVDAHHCAFIHYLRTGDRKYYDFAEAMTRHHMDVDTINWHTNEALIGMGHRHDIDHWGGGPGSSHGWVNGYLDYYYLSGYGRAMDMSRLVGEYFMKKPFRQCLQGNASRDAVNGWWGIMRLWEATGDERYKKASDEAAAAYVKFQRPDGFWDQLMFGYMGQATPTWHWLSGNEDCKKVMLNQKAIQGGVMGNALGNPAAYFAYQYWITGETKYLVQGYREMYGGGRNSLKKATEPLGVESYGHARIVVNGGLPYFMAALYDAGIKGVKLDGFLAKRQPLAAPLNALEGTEFVPLDLSAVVNRTPYAEPFPLRVKIEVPADRAQFVKRFRALEPGEVGFQFGVLRDPLASGYHRVTRFTLWPAAVDAPVLSDNFYGVPFGAVATFGGVPFRLADPGQTDGRSVLVLDTGQSVAIPVAMKARRIHFLGHVHRYASFETIDDLADFEAARYTVRYADGTSEEVALKNLQHFEDIMAAPAAAAVAVVRPRRYYGQGDWTPHLNLFTLTPQQKEIERIEFADAGRGVNPALVAVTVERDAGAAPDVKPVVFTFGKADPQAQPPRVSSASIYQPGGVGWAKGDGLKDDAAAVLIGEDNAFRATVTPGPYTVTLGVAASAAAEVGLTLSLQGERRLHHVLIPSEWTQELSFDTVVADGVLDVAFTRTGFGRAGALALRQVSLRPLAQPPQRRPATPAAPPAAVCGWSDPGSLECSSRYLGLQSVGWERPMRFHVAMPDGRYAVELMMTAWYPGHDLYVDVSVNEKKVLASQHMRVPQVYKFEADVAGGRLDLLIQSDVERTSSRAPRWEVNSLVLRRL